MKKLFFYRSISVKGVRCLNVHSLKFCSQGRPNEIDLLYAEHLGYSKILDALQYLRKVCIYATAFFIKLYMMPLYHNMDISGSCTTYIWHCLFTKEQEDVCGLHITPQTLHIFLFFPRNGWEHVRENTILCESNECGVIPPLIATHKVRLL